MEKIQLTQLNYLHCYNGKLYVIHGEDLLEITSDLHIVQTSKLSFKFKSAPCANYFKPFGRDNLVFQKNELYSLRGPDTCVVKHFERDFKTNICDWVAISGEGFYHLSDSFDATFSAEIQCLPASYIRFYYFDGQIGVSLEEETSYYGIDGECHQIQNSCLGDPLLCLGRYVLDECRAYYDVCSGCMVYPTSDSFDILQYLRVSSTAELSVSRGILAEFNNLDYDDKPWDTLFGYAQDAKKDEM